MRFHLLIVLLTLLATSSLAAQTLTVAGGQTVGADSQHDSARIEGNFNWKPDLWSNDSLSLSLDHAVSLGGFWDLNNVYFISWAPNFILAPADRSGLYPYFQFGVGLALLSDDRFEYYVPYPWLNGRSDMGSLFQFENGLAVGLVYQRLNLRAKFYHYSNGGLSSRNGGMNVLELGVGYRLH